MFGADVFWCGSFHSPSPDKSCILYGKSIGYALQHIAQGHWVSEDLLQMPKSPDLQNLPIDTHQIPIMEHLQNYTFEGYRNADGSVGTRNVLAISKRFGVV